MVVPRRAPISQRRREGAYEAARGEFGIINRDRFDRLQSLVPNRRRAASYAPSRLR